MNWLLSLPMLFQNFGSISKLLPLVQKYFSGEADLDDLLKDVRNLPSLVVKALEYVGSQRFPALAPGLHAIAVLTTSFHGDRIAWFQDAYNQLMQPQEPLVVDGIPGPKTDAAIISLQAKFGLPADGWMGKVTHDFVMNLLANKDTVKRVTDAADNLRAEVAGMVATADAGKPHG